MCYGDVAYGKDGYYAEWLERAMREQEEEQHNAEEAARTNEENPFP